VDGNTKIKFFHDRRSIKSSTIDVIVPERADGQKEAKNGE
jgi:hypothetical protein